MYEWVEAWDHGFHPLVHVSRETHVKIVFARTEGREKEQKAKAARFSRKLFQPVVYKICILCYRSGII